MVSLSPPLDARVGAAQDRRFGPFVAPALSGMLIYAVLVLAPQVLNDGDTFWHLAAGQWMLDHGQVLRTDVFSHTAAGRSWNTHEWLAEVLMALAFRAGGWNGVVILYGLAGAAAMGALAHRLGRSLPPLSLACALVLTFGCMAPSLLARPHLIGLALLVFWTIGLMQARDGSRAPSLWLAAMMVLWANLHGGYVFGLAMIAPFALEAIAAAQPGQRTRAFRDWTVFGVAGLAAALVTPFGVSGLIYPFKILGMSSLPGITEWRPTDFSRPGALEITLVAALFVMLQRGVRIPPFRLGLLLLLLHMTLQHTRHQIVLAAVGALLLAEPLGAALARPPERERCLELPAARRWLLGCVLLAVIVSCVRLVVPVVRTDGPTAPITALRHVPAVLRAQPVFNDYGFGGYLIWQGVRPFIDGRSDMYGDAFTQAYFKAEQPDPATLEALLARWKVAWTLLAANDPVVGVMDRKPGWRRLYADRYAVVHVHDGAL